MRFPSGLSNIPSSTPYASSMSPATQPSPRPSNGSFASMLERLTGVASDSQSQSFFEDTPATSDRYQQTARFEPRNASVDQAAPKASPSAKAPAAPRSLLAVKQVQPAKPHHDSEPAPLSYEKALRLHSRSQPSNSTTVTQPTPAEPALKAAPAAHTGTSTQRSKPARAPVAPVQHPLPKVKRSASTSQLASVATTKPGVKAYANPAGKQQQAPPAASAVQASTKTAKSTTLPSESPSASRRAKAKHRTSPSKRTPQPKPKIEFQAPGLPALPATTDHEIVRLINRMNSADRVPQQGALDLQSSHKSQLDFDLAHRTATISVRLNEAEFSDLRQRAAESGISVSAYMRSCVLEAEHLRSQVKQALIAMRAATLTEPALLPASTGDRKKSNVQASSSSWVKRLRGLAARLTGLQPTPRHPL